MAKKETKNNDVNINDIDSMVADVKKLAMKKQNKTAKKTQVSVKKKNTENVNKQTKPTDDNIAKSVEETEIGKIDNKIGPEPPIILESKEDFDKVYKEQTDNTKDTEEKIENKEDNEDFSFIDELKQEKPNGKEPQKKSIKISSYGQAYTPTWCGYGYTEK